MFFLTSLAFAAEPASVGYSGTTFFPDARHRDPMTVEAAGGGVGVLMYSDNTCIVAGPGCGPQVDPVAAGNVRLAWTIVADLRVEGHFGYGVSDDGLGSLSLSWSTPVSKVVRLGAFFGGAGSAWSGLTQADGALGGGVTMGARWPRVAFDLSLPLFVLNSPGEETPLYLPWLFADVSTSFALGKGHSLRVGMLSVAPGVGWQYTGKHLFARADLHSLGVITGARAEVGAVF